MNANVENIDIFTRKPIELANESDDVDFISVEIVMG